MAKRFFNTSRIDEDWYLALSLKHRELIRYCESKCDGAGVFPFAERVATMYIGEKIKESDLKKIGAEKLPNGKFWLPYFIDEQNSELKESCPAHKPIFKSLKENEITLSNRVFSRVSNTLQEKEIVIDKEIEQETEISKIVYPFESENFTRAWDGWKEYKKSQHRFTYKGDNTEQIALKDLAEKSGNNEQTAIQIIQQSIASGWKGFFELKNNNNGKSTNISQSTAADIDRKMSEHIAAHRTFMDRKVNKPAGSSTQ